MRSEHTLPGVARFRRTLAAAIAVAMTLTLAGVGGAAAEASPAGTELAAATLPAADPVGSRPTLGAAPRQTRSSHTCTPQPRAKCAGAHLRGVQWRKADLRRANLRNANLRGADLRGANLHKAKLRGANLRGANLRGANLSSAQVRQVNLRQANLRKANLRKTNLRESNLQRAVVRNADARRANLNTANLRKSNWAGANLFRADLRNSDARQAVIRNANLDSARAGNANMRGTVFGNTSIVGTGFSGTEFGDEPAQTVVLPQQGQDIVQAIDAASQTVDIVIYEIGGPNIVGQAGAPGALMDAIARGVNVRITVNGQWYNDDCEQATPQSECAEYYKVDWIYATQVSLQAAAAAASNPGTFELNFANNNFEVTHQKTVLIDATDPATGLPLTAAQLPSTARALVSTGNLNAFGWGDKSLVNPAEDCGQGCIEWSARDFLINTPDPTLIAEIASVFYSDFFCGAEAPGTTASRTNTNGLLGTTLPLTWSNGATWPQAPGNLNQYPDAATGYPFDPEPGTTIQGNARARTLALINSAQHSLIVYNEEMSDTDTVNALVAASKRLGPGKVRIVMTMDSKWWPAWTQLAEAGVDIRVTQADSPHSQQLYIHAKVIVADSTDAFMGSENISYASLNFNRELGLLVTTRVGAGPNWLRNVRAVQAFVNTFESDWKTPGYLNWDVTAQAAAQSGQLPQGPALATASDEVARMQSSGGFPMLCGPIPARP